MKSQSREIGLNHHITLKFDRYIGSSTTELPVKFQSVHIILNTNLVASRPSTILQQDVLSDIETGPRPSVSTNSALTSSI